MTGTIKRLVTDRGFGFLYGEDGQQYFLHRTDMAAGSSFADLAEDDPVTFELVMPTPEKGPRAGKVRLMEAATPAA